MSNSVAELEREADRIQKALDAVKAKIKALASIPDTVWRVNSRSNRRPHLIVVSGGNWSCHCDGAINDRICWALKGVRSAVEKNPATATFGTISFWDENLSYHTATRISGLAR